MKTTKTTHADTAPANPRKFRKARSIALQMGVHSKTVFRWADAGLISRFKVNDRVVLFDEEEVQRYIESTRVGK